MLKFQRQKTTPTGKTMPDSELPESDMSQAWTNLIVGGGFQSRCTDHWVRSEISGTAPSGHTAYLVLCKLLEKRKRGIVNN